MGLERAAAALLPQKQSGGLFLARGRVPRRKAQVGKAFVPCFHPGGGGASDFHPLSHFVTAPPEWGAKEETDCHDSVRTVSQRHA